MMTMNITSTGLKENSLFVFASFYRFLSPLEYHLKRYIISGKCWYKKRSFEVAFKGYMVVVGLGYAKLQL